MSNLSIRDFFRNKSVFITGATGFLGKALLEKLLRSCPEINTVYVLIRRKTESGSVQSRINQLLQSSVFDTLRSSKNGAEALQKVHPICGDIELPHLDMNDADRNLLISNVSVVIHSAATVRFDEVLSQAIEQNVNGTRRILEICKMMKNLQALVHMSTAYSNCDRKFVEEKVYPPPEGSDEIIKVLLSEGTNGKYFTSDFDNMEITSRPNSYTFTKAIAEHFITLEGGNLPMCIVRPSIVTAAFREPVPGWIDNINGPTGLFVGVGMGALRVLLGDSHKAVNLIPVDIIVNMTLCAAWETAMNGKLMDNSVASVASPTTSLTKVYNFCTSHTNPMTLDKLTKELVLFQRGDSAFSKAVSYPSAITIKNETLYNLADFVKQHIPAAIIDTFSGNKKKISALKTHSNLKVAMKAVSYFILHEWVLPTDNLDKLRANLNVEDRHIFDFQTEDMSWKEYIYTYCIGIRRFIMKEEESTLPKAQARMRKLYYVYLARNISGALFSIVLFMSFLNKVINF